jgi:hypothetical protein
MTGPAAGNSAAASATLTVTSASVAAPAKSGGGGTFDWLDIMLVAGVLLIVRTHAARRPPGH